MAMMKCIKVRPGCPAAETEIDDSLNSLQRFVDGYIEITYPFDDDVIVIGNEEAKLLGMQGNRRINGEIYAGSLLLVGDDHEGGLRSLTDEETAKYLELFKEPEEISDDEVQNDIGFRFFCF